MADHDGASCAERDLELLQSTRQAVVHDMIQRCRRLAGGALACLVLLVLHLIHGSTLLLALFLHLINHIRLSTSTSTLTRPGGNTSDNNSNPSTKALSDDITIWKNKKKIPSCLGVIFVPSARGYFSVKKFRYTAWSEDVVFQGMMEDVIKIVSWSRRLEIDSLLLYDENGIFKQHHRYVKDKLRGSTSTCLNSTTSFESLYEISEQTFILDNAIRITLLSREDGKDHIAKVSKSISKGVRAGFISREGIDVDYIQEKLYASLCPEPDLLIVLGGLHLRLRGFPPWHTRLCEIYHDSSLSLLGPPRLRYAAFRRAMDNYAGCQQRFGR